MCFVRWGIYVRMRCVSKVLFSPYEIPVGIITAFLLSLLLAIIGIIVENPDSVSQINDILHEVRDYVVGRMGIPYRSKGINIISVAFDAPQDVISALSGKIGNIDGISAKTAYSNVVSDD